MWMTSSVSPELVMPATSTNDDATPKSEISPRVKDNPCR
jgi:hypothetical protein